jgi:hypothetical protein
MCCPRYPGDARDRSQSHPPRAVGARLAERVDNHWLFCGRHVSTRELSCEDVSIRRLNVTEGHHGRAGRDHVDENGYANPKKVFHRRGVL